MDELDLERLEYETQHEATWQTLQAAASQRDLVVKLHGGLLAVITIAGPALASKYAAPSLVRLILGYVAAGCLLLGFTTYNFLRGVQSLRLLQFEMYSANRYARYRLGGGGSAQTYFSYLIERPEVRRLNQQLDPMGLMVQNVRHYLLADAFLAPSAAIAIAAVGRSAAGSTAIAVAAAAAGAMSVSLVRWRIDKQILRGEQETSDRVVKRYQDLGVKFKHAN